MFYKCYFCILYTEKTCFNTNTSIDFRSNHAFDWHKFTSLCIIYHSLQLVALLQRSTFYWNWRREAKDPNKEWWIVTIFLRTINTTAQLYHFLICKIWRQTKNQCIKSRWTKICAKKLNYDSCQWAHWCWFRSVFSMRFHEKALKFQGKNVDFFYGRCTLISVENAYFVKWTTDRCNA